MGTTVLLVLVVVGAVVVAWRWWVRRQSPTVTTTSSVRHMYANGLLSVEEYTAVLLGADGPDARQRALATKVLERKERELARLQQELQRELSKRERKAVEAQVAALRGAEKVDAEIERTTKRQVSKRRRRVALSGSDQPNYPAGPGVVAQSPGATGTPRHASDARPTNEETPLREDAGAPERQKKRRSKRDRPSGEVIAPGEIEDDVATEFIDSKVGAKLDKAAQQEALRTERAAKRAERSEQRRTARDQKALEKLQAANAEAVKHDEEAKGGGLLAAQRSKAAIRREERLLVREEKRAKREEAKLEKERRNEERTRTKSQTKIARLEAQLAARVETDAFDQGEGRTDTDQGTLESGDGVTAARDESTVSDVAVVVRGEVDSARRVERQLAKNEASEAKRQAREERRHLRNQVREERLRLKAEARARKAHEEELERNLKSLREGDKTKILATRRAKRMGIDVVPLPVNRNLAGTSTIEGSHEWGVESGTGSEPDVYEVDFDWRSAGLPEPLPRRR